MRIRVINAQHTFNDYGNGDTATVTKVGRDGSVHVKWDKVRFPDDPWKETVRCEYLLAAEYEVIE